MKTWMLKNIDKDYVMEISKKHGVSPIVALLLYNRGRKSDHEINSFLNPSMNVAHDPFLMKNMDLVAKEIKKAIENKIKITIYGDYDVDGITSVAVLYKFLKEKECEVNYYIPDRINEGYGINKNALDKIKAKGTELIITVDTGISAREEIKYANSIGVRIIVTDHHEGHGDMSDICLAIDPKQNGCEYPFKELAGVGVVLKLLLALEPDRAEELIEKYSPFVALGTIADIAQLLDENRFYVKEGLKRMSNSPNVGIKNLISKLHNRGDITSNTVSFTFAPRINASGRLGNAEMSLELFLTDDSKTAEELTDSLNQANTERQQIERQTLKEALEILENDPDVEKKNILIIHKEGWHHGIIGIVSSKITERFNKPSILLSIDGENAKGSGRGTGEFNIFESLKYCSDTVKSFGGHEFAVGLTLKTDKIESFKEKINEYANLNYKRPESFNRILSIDAILKASFISVNVFNDISVMQPFGMGNPEPLFVIKNLKIKKLKYISDDKHIIMTLLKDEKYIETIGFQMANRYKDILHVNDSIDIAFSFNYSQRVDSRGVQLILRDIKLIN